LSSSSLQGLSRPWARRPAVSEPVELGAAANTLVAPRVRLTPLSAILLVFTTFMVISQWADYDVFWHLANGRLWVKDGIFPSPDRFSWTAAGLPVNLNSFLVDRCFYWLWELGGGKALAICAALLFVGFLVPYALMIGRLGLNPAAEAASLLFLIIAVLPYRGARPHLVGAILFGLMLLTYTRPFGMKKALAGGILLGTWVNVHGFFVVGFMFVGSAVVCWTLEGDRRAALLASLALPIGAAATLLSPVGLELWKMPFRIDSNPVLTYNLDWLGLRPFTVGYAPMGLLIVAAAALGVWRRPDPRALAALVLIFGTIQYARFIPLAAPLLVVLVLERLVEQAPWLKVNPLGELGRTMADARLNLAAAAILLVGVLAVCTKAPTQIAEASFYSLPETAVDRLLACGSPAPVMNDYNWGGYLIWRSEGTYTTVMDGRAEALYPVQIWKDYFSAKTDYLAWVVYLQSSPAQYILMPTEATLHLDSLPGWHIVYADDIALLAARDTATWNC